MSKKSHHFLTLWPWPLTYDLEKLIRSGHYHYQCVYQIWEQSIPWFLSYRVNTIAGGGRLRRKTITSPVPSDTGDIIIAQWTTRNKLKLIVPWKIWLWFQLCTFPTHSMGIDILSIEINIILEWMPEALVDDKSTLVQVMAWCWQATSHYPGFYTKGRPLVKSNLICPSDKLSWRPGCPVLNNKIQGNFCIRAAEMALWTTCQKT